MSKAKDKKKSDDDKKSDAPKQKEKYEFNLSDGFDYHDVVGLFVLIFIFIWKVIRLILSPVFWIIGENLRMWRFIRASGDERTMNEDEQKFVETLPFIFTLTGVIGGLIVGIFFAFSVSNSIDDFFNSINADFFKAIFDLIAGIIYWIYKAIKWVFTGLWDIFGFIGDSVKSLFESNPVVAFIVLATVGIIVILLWVAISEQGILQKIFGLLGRTLVWLIGSPDRFRFRVDNYYRRLNHKLTVIIIGEGKLITRTQLYFRRVALYSFIAAAYSFFAGIYVGITNSSDLTNNYQKVGFISLVLFVAGLLSGFIFFGLIARFLDLLSRAKYISPEFKNTEGDVDAQAIENKKKADKEERDKAYKEYQAQLEKMSEKPWKKREDEKPKKKSSPKKEEKAESEEKKDE